MKRMSFDDYSTKARKCNFGGQMGKGSYERMDDDEHAAHMAKLGKSEEGDDDDDDDERDPDEERDEREDPEDGDDDAEKSLAGLTEDELSKAMDTILYTARTSGKTGAQIRLEDLSKSSAAGTLTASERAELVGLLESAPVGSAGAENFAKSMESDPDVQSAMALDATEFVSSLVDALSKSLDDVGAEIGDLRKSTGDFNQRLAEGLDVFARTVDAKLQVMATGGTNLAARLEAVEKSAVSYRGFTSAPRTPLAAVHDPRSPVDVSTLAKGGAVSVNRVKRAALEMLEKSSDTNESTDLSALVCRLDSFRGPDWRALPEASVNPELTAKVIARATTA